MKEELSQISDLLLTDPAAARDMVMKLLEYHPIDKKVLEYTAECHMLTGDMENAERYALRLLDLYPDSRMAVVVLDRVELQRTAQMRIDELKSMLRLSDTMAEGHKLLADLLFNIARGNPQHLEAIEHQKEYLKLVPGDFDAWMTLAYYYFYIAWWEALFEICAHARSIDPSSGKSYVIEGRSLMMQGMHDQAMMKFQTALTVDPQCVSAYGWIAHLLQLKGDYIKAAHCLLYALQTDSDHHRTWTLLINLMNSPLLEYFACNEYSSEPSELLIRICETALMHTQSESKESLELRRRIFEKLGDNEKAKIAGRRYAELYPFDKWTYLLKPMLDDDFNHEDMEYADEEIDDVDDDDDSYLVDNFGHLIPDKAADVNQLDEINRMWELFLDHKLTAPEL
ncbi:MAG: tetratricopeptide repeat protein [Armatimonadota bacterium]